MPKQLLIAWRKSDSQRIRRLNALSVRKFDYLAAARALQYLANISGDAETRRKARADSHYFFSKYKRMKKYA